MDLVPVNARRRRGTWCTLWALLTAFAFAPSRTAAEEVGPIAGASAADALPPSDRTAAWPWQRQRRPLFSIAPSAPDTPHAAVARIIVPEEGMTAYGTGTLIDVRDQFGLVITNWHVVRDYRGTVEVKFPNGFRSQARPLKVDADWDLAALVIWRPPVEPVRVSQSPPGPGDVLTIHGYGQGQYRIATGRCTAFYAPKLNFPQEMLELDVEARQGDSGGPIFNQQGELAGVLFGAGEGTTIGSFAPRVESFLASLAPDIGQARDQALVAVADRPAPEVHPIGEQRPPLQLVRELTRPPSEDRDATPWPSSPWTAAASPTVVSTTPSAADAIDAPVSWRDVADSRWYDGLKSLLAVVGLVAVALQLIRIVK
jgi:hypothetical protein